LSSFPRKRESRLCCCLYKRKDQIPAFAGMTSRGRSATQRKRKAHDEKAQG
jgi:hypothetical protein